MTWASATIGDLVDSGEAQVKTGPFGTQLHASDYVESGTPVINVRNIGFGNIRKDKLEFIADDTVQRLSSHLLQPNDIVFGRKGAVERHVYIQQGQDKWFQGSDCLRLRMVSEGRVLARYLSYVFLTKEHQSWMMQQCSHGATMPSLNQDIIKRITLNLPPLPTQRRFTSVLSTYDDLIENNTRRIAVLEEMARRLYEEWFVHFRFPGYEEAKFAESSQGAIPEGWVLSTIGNVADLRWGDTNTTKKAYVEEGYTAFSAAGPDGLLPYYDFDQKGIVVSAIGAHCGLTWLTRGKWSCIKNTIRLWSTNEGVSNEFLFFATEGKDSWPKRGSAQPFISQADARSLPIVVPPLMLERRFRDMAVPCLELAHTLDRKNINLRSQRDLLLPKLISGEIDVSKATEIAQDAAE